MKQELCQKSRKANGIKKYFFAAVISVMIAAVLAVAVFVYFFVPKNDGIYTVTIPDFVGKSLSGTDRIENIEVVTNWVNSEDVPEGIVISQEPYASARRKIRDGESCTVVLTVSLGEKRELMPDLIAMPYLSAAAALRSLGARVKTVAIYSDRDDGLVSSTLPVAGTAIRQGDSVVLYVNRKRVDKSICVPDFCGMTLGEAMRYALSKGLYAVSSDDIDGDELVISQSLRKGSYVKKGSYIAFEVSGAYQKEEPEKSEKTDTQKA